MGFIKGMLITVTRFLLRVTKKSLQMGIDFSSLTPVTVRYPSLLIMYSGVGIIRLTEYVMDTADGTEA